MSADTGLAHALATSDELTLITTGRRTGREHAVRLWFAYEDGVLWLRADAGADWLRNLETRGSARVRVGDREIDAHVVPVVDRDEALRRLVALWRAKYGAEWVSDWYVERGRVPVTLRLADRP